MTEVGSLGYGNADTILNNHVSMQAFQDSMANLGTTIVANKAAYCAGQQQSATQNKMAASMQLVQHQI